RRNNGSRISGSAISPFGWGDTPELYYDDEPSGQSFVRCDSPPLGDLVVRRRKFKIRSGTKALQLRCPFRKRCSLSRAFAWAYDPASLLLTVVKVALALVPSAVIATRQTTMIRANMTAYSTAVGPSSLLKNVLMRVNIFYSSRWK